MRKHSQFIGIALTAFGLVAILAPTAHATIVYGQVDDFEDGTTMTWGGGASPTNIPTGGPAGAGDHYLQLTATGGNGPGSRLASYNDNQWTGDFTSAGVTSIEADLRNFSATTDLEIRLLLFGDGGNFTSTIAVIIPDDGAWHHVVFGLTAADLTAVDGGFDLPATLAGNNRLMIRHQTGPPAGLFSGTVIAGEMGIDNVAALPEPGTIGLLALGGLFLFRRRR